MSKAAEIGRFGEQAAADYLIVNGFVILERNYRKRVGEIDIIAENERFVAFVEVKTRAAGAMVSGLEAVDVRKMRKIVKTAALWLQGNNTNKQPRFDVIEIITSGVGTNIILELNHIPNAFDGDVCSEIF